MMIIMLIMRIMLISLPSTTSTESLKAQLPCTSPDLDHNDNHVDCDHHDHHNESHDHSPPQHDLHRKPQGTIALHESCRVSRAEGSNTFEIATNGDDDDYDADGE